MKASVFVGTSLDGFIARTDGSYFAAQHYERQGHLEFVHSVTGVRTLKDEFEKVLLTIRTILGQIRAALSGAPWPAA